MNIKTERQFNGAVILMLSKCFSTKSCPITPYYVKLHLATTYMQYTVIVINFAIH